MDGRPPLTDAEYDRVRELHALGWTRNAIAREIDRSVSSVTKMANQLGLAFDHAATAAATEAKVVDAKARRADLALGLLDDIDKLRAQLFAPCMAFNFGGRDNTYAETPLTEPVFADKLKIMQAVGAAIDRHLALAKHDADPGIDAGKSMLAALEAGLGAAYETLTSTPADDAA